jgi:hypothetical protein
MRNDSEAEIARLAASLTCGSIVAAAGCGKTEQIAQATAIASGRRLILTHTHAGVDALRLRLKRHSVPSGKYRLETIAGWCLWYAASFPKRSGLCQNNPKDDREWIAVYEATLRLIRSGAVDGVLTSSYSGIFVDEYQDCTLLQHQVIQAIADYFPVCIFGDPLQAIFDFKGQNPVDWETDVFPVFKEAAQLNTPWRWKNTGNDELAEWLVNLRYSLEKSEPIDLSSRPGCVRWELLPSAAQSRQSKIIATCKAVMGKTSDGRLAIIADPANINARAALAQKLAAVGFSNIEPIGCKTLYEFGKKLETTMGMVRLETCLDFICACMTGADRKAYLDAVQGHLNGSKRGQAKFGDLVRIGAAVVKRSSEQPVNDLLAGFQHREATRIYRREMFFAMRSALQIKSTRQSICVTDAICEVQNRISHAGRTIGKRTVGSTLLLKGLEVEHSVIIHASNMSRKDWYVALTRASSTVTVLSPSECFSPAI